MLEHNFISQCKLVCDRSSSVTALPEMPVMNIFYAIPVQDTFHISILSYLMVVLFYLIIFFFFFQRGNGKGDCDSVILHTL